MRLVNVRAVREHRGLVGEPDPAEQVDRAVRPIPVALADVYDVLGRRVATPVLSREVDGSASIDLSGQLPRSLGSGTYFFRVWNEDFTATTKAVRVR